MCSVPGSAPQTPHDFAGYQPTSYTRSRGNQEIRKSVIMQVKHRDTSQHSNHLPANILHNACVIEVCNSLAFSTEDGAHEKAPGSPVTLLALTRHKLVGASFSSPADIALPNRMNDLAIGYCPRKCCPLNCRASFVVKVAKLVIIFKAGKQWHCGSLAEELLKVK